MHSISPAALWRCLLASALLIALLATLPAAAVPVPDLHSAQVPLADNSPEARQEAFETAISIVTARLAGQGAVSAPQMDALRAGAGAYVQQFTQRDENTLWVAFNGQALERALRAAGFSVWSSDRPSILVWLVVDNGSGRRLVGADDVSSAKAQIDQAARQRGLPLVWPLLDSTDLANVTAADVWGGFDDKVNLASRRYGAGAVLTARLTERGGGGAFGRFELQTGSGAHFTQGDARTGLNGIGDYLASQLSVSGNDRTVVAITVSQVDSVDDYAVALRFLQRSALIETVTPVAVDADRVRFEAVLNSDPVRVERALSVGGPFAVADEPGLLQFRIR